MPVKASRTLKRSVRDRAVTNKGTKSICGGIRSRMCAESGESDRWREKSKLLLSEGCLRSSYICVLRRFGMQAIVENSGRNVIG